MLRGLIFWKPYIRQVEHGQAKNPLLLSAVWRKFSQMDWKVSLLPWMEYLCGGSGAKRGQISCHLARGRSKGEGHCPTTTPQYLLSARAHRVLPLRNLIHLNLSKLWAYWLIFENEVLCDIFRPTFDCLSPRDHSLLFFWDSMYFTNIPYVSLTDTNILPCVSSRI